jgi:uncharacterized membrane protein YebE (DUF533 family)
MNCSEGNEQIIRTVRERRKIVARGYCIRACAVDSRPCLLARRPVEGSVTKYGGVQPVEALAGVEYKAYSKFKKTSPPKTHCRSELAEVAQLYECTANAKRWTRQIMRE